MRVLLILTFLMGSLEIAAQRSFVQNRLLTPGLNSPQPEFEIKLAYLNAFVETHGKVECIFLGSSVVWASINPTTFAETYAAETGETLTCFNFGISALSVVSASEVAEYLVKNYQPRYLFYGMTAGEFVRTEKQALLNTDWFSYQQGDFSLKGWLLDHSYAFRYYQRYQNWRFPDFRQELQVIQTLENEIWPNGFRPQSQPVLDVRTVPSRELDGAIFEFLSDYSIKPESLAGLEKLISLKNRTELIFLEIPTHPSYIQIFENGEVDYEIFVQTIGLFIRERGLRFWETSRLNLVPDADGWYDRNHLTHKGAEIFSRWLGTQGLTSQ